MSIYDNADAALNMTQMNMEISIRHMQSRIFQMRIDEKVIRPRNCIDCDKPIPLKRLKAIPGAIRCIECQVIFEREQGHQGVFDEYWR